MEIVRNPAAGSGRLEGSPIFNIPMSQQDSSNAMDLSRAPNSRDDAMNSLWERWIKYGDTAAYEKYIDKVIEYENDKTAIARTEHREDTAYQRLEADLRKAGISPYILSGASPFAGAATFHSTTGSQMTSASNNKRSEEVQLTKSALSTVGAVLAAIGMIIAHVL